MINTEYLKTREDGVKLFKTIDAKVDENGNFLKDENNQLIPTGFHILQIETGVLYSEAVDVEGALYTYNTTDVEIPTPEK